MSSMRFTPGWKYPHKEGKLYCGVTPLLRQEVGVKTDKHAISFAATGSGKSVAVDIQNALRWPQNLLQIDPKGEIAEATIRYREKKFGQRCLVLDPFRQANIPDRYRASFDFFDTIDPKSGRAFESIGAIADGLVIKHDPRGGHWDGGGKTVLSGYIAHMLSRYPRDRVNLIALRRTLKMTGENKNKFRRELAQNTAFGGLPIAAYNKLTESKREAPHFISKASSNTEWLDSPAFADTLSKSSFKLSDLKHKPMSVYLVLPLDLLSEHGRFLRLFVRCAIDAMLAGDPGRHKCLFMLDEAAALGNLDKLKEAYGTSRGAGLRIWTIWQNLSQLVDLYDSNGAQTFFGNSGLQQWFGTLEQEGIEFISRQMGTRQSAGMFDRHAESVGKPFMSPQEVRAHIAHESKDIVARRMIAFVQGRDVLSLRLKPYFQDRAFADLKT